MDTNSAYFFSKVAARRNINSIAKVQDMRGNICEDTDSIGTAFEDYSKNLLGEYDRNVVPELEIIKIGPCLTAELQQMLIQAVTLEEIRKALFSIDQKKSPGPDAYSSGFFQQAWGIIQDDFTRAVADFFKTKKLLKEINSTVITLIPMKENANTVLEYRPISCCNIIYKTIIKILANRLKLVLPNLIGQEQAAFVQGRSIFDNTLLTQELIRGYGKTNISPRCMIKIDIQKAFDSVDWQLLQQMLLAMGFLATFTPWLITCVTSTKYSLKINGSLVGGDVASVQVAINGVNQFATLSGIKANAQKSCIYFGGVKQHIKNAILHSTHFSQGAFPFRYLGFSSLIQQLLAWKASGALGDRRIIFFSWDKICKSTRAVGFDIREILSWNKTFMMKQFWKLTCNTETVWAEWIHSYIIKDADIWTIQPLVTSSSIWKRLINLRDKLIQLVGVHTAKHLHDTGSPATRLRRTYQIFRRPSHNLYWTKAIIDPVIMPGIGLFSFLLCIIVSQQLITSVKEAFTWLVDVPYASKLRKLHSTSSLLGFNRHHLSLNHELRWLAKVTGKNWGKKWAKCNLAALVYSLWAERNARIFQDTYRSTDQLIYMIKKVIRVRLLAYVTGLTNEADGASFSF
ncbi:uncharacterized protein LOC141607756 [Silene latifolia]|uniref:uncharacterized protein LOC141607756 n=1 Tax=Silene latifolia TaxID=37657 RepID=UPI003D776CB3